MVSESGLTSAREEGRRFRRSCEAKWSRGDRRRVDQMLWNISRQLFQARSATGRSQENVAHEAELAVRTYRRLETGAGRSTIDSLLRAMIVLKLDHLVVGPVSTNVTVAAASAPPSSKGPTCPLRYPGRLPTAPGKHAGERARDS